MPDFVDNTAGYSEVTGTSDYLMTTTGTGLHLRLDQALVDAQEVAYYAVGTSNGVDAFESGVGTWDDSENTLVVGTITNSSNGGGKISWDAGDKTIYIVSSADMLTDMELMTEGATKKILTPAERAAIAAVVSADELDAAAQLDGTEIIPGLQDGSGVGITTQQISGSPLTDARSLAKDRSKGYSNFSKIRGVGYTSADAGVLDLEPFKVHQSGAGASIIQAHGVLGEMSIIGSTGTTTTGYSAITHLEWHKFDPAKEMDFRVKIAPIQLPTAGQNYTLQIGFVSGAPALATHGMYFQLDETNTKWQAIVRNTGVSAATPTTVDATALGVVDLRVHYDPSVLSTKFYINGTLAATTLNTTKVVPTDTQMETTISIRKSALTTAASYVAQHLSFDCEKTALVNF